MFEERPDTKLKGLKVMIKKKSHAKKKTITKKITDLRDQLREKREYLQDAYKRLNAFKSVVTRNRIQEEQVRQYHTLTDHEINDKMISDGHIIRKNIPIIHDQVIEKLNFPLIIVSTPNTSDNQVNL